MQVFQTKTELRAFVKVCRQAGKHIAFVPTMGNLHQGHLSLVEKAKSVADIVIVSIFVNPTQFDRAEDLEHYPRTEAQDQQYLQNLSVDALFLPSVETMYPSISMRIDVGDLGHILEGASRTGHFSGVATVVAKLFNLVQPDVAIFGEKDYQQLMLIRQLVDSFDMPVDIVGMPTFREQDGLAMSSRNGYLTKEERAIAPAFFDVLSWVKSSLQQRIEYTETYFLHLQDAAKQRLIEAGLKPDYIEVRRQSDLQEAWRGDEERQLVVLGAAWLGKARLIDNISLTL
jgi:pantoate--beta-alanine ligase